MTATLENLARAACALLLFAAPSAAQGAGDGAESLRTKAGVLSVVRTSEEDFKWELRLGGRTVLETEGPTRVNFEAHFPNLSQGEVVVVSFGSGGNACPAQFRVLRVVSAGKVDVSDEFGDCSDSPTITLRQLPEEEITIGFTGYYQLWQSREPGFRKPPPSAYVYKKGVLSEVKPPAVKGRG